MGAKENFVDEVFVTLTSGDGGNGMVSMHRGKSNPFGGPDGGDGGRGGDVVLFADPNLRTLLDIRHRREIKAKRGEDGGSRDMKGASADSIVIRVPVGTEVYNDDSEQENELLFDLQHDDQREVICRGGKGGLGNARFKSSTRQAPRFATPGKPGESYKVKLTLKLIADVGFIGFPNAGKSTLLRQLSNARPRVASYPFTTLVPSLGVVERGERRFVAADIPGLIEGASSGAGLGDRFLRHIERTRVLVHLLDCGAMLFEGRDLVRDYETIRRELERYSADLATRPELVVLNKVELFSDPGDLADLEASLAAIGIETLKISGVTGKGCRSLVDRLLQEIDKADERADAEDSAREVEQSGASR